MTRTAGREQQRTNVLTNSTGFRRAKSSEWDRDVLNNNVKDLRSVYSTVQYRSEQYRSSPTRRPSFVFPSGVRSCARGRSDLSCRILHHLNMAASPLSLQLLRLFWLELFLSLFLISITEQVWRGCWRNYSNLPSFGYVLRSFRISQSWKYFPYK